MFLLRQIGGPGSSYLHLYSKNTVSALKARHAGGKLLQLKAALSTAPPPPPGASSAIFDVESMADFQNKVVNSKVPVVIDAYANWCQPCKQLTPLLEKAVTAAKGKLVLAKIDVDAQPELARALNIRSLPSVFCLSNGKMVDAFQGMPPQGQLQQFFAKALTAAGSGQDEDEEDNGIDKKAQSPEEMVSAALKMVREGHAEEVEEFLKRTYQVLVEKDAAPSAEPLLKAKCLAGLAWCNALKGQMEDATALIASVKKSFSAEASSDAEIKAAVAQVDIMLTEPDGEGDALEAAAAAAPGDLGALLALARKRAAQGRHAEALDLALQIVREDMSWNNGAGKELTLQIFESLGPDSEITKTGRRRLTNLLFV